MIAPPPNVRIWLACGHTDMRKGFDSLAALAQGQLGHDPFSGQLFVFSRPPWRSGQGAVLGRTRLVPVRQAA
jgi:transposase